MTPTNAHAPTDTPETSPARHPAAARLRRALETPENIAARLDAMGGLSGAERRARLADAHVDDAEAHLAYLKGAIARATNALRDAEFEQQDAHSDLEFARKYAPPTTPPARSLAARVVRAFGTDHDAAVEAARDALERARDAWGEAHREYRAERTCRNLERVAVADEALRDAEAAFGRAIGEYIAARGL